MFITESLFDENIKVFTSRFRQFLTLPASSNTSHRPLDNEIFKIFPYPSPFLTSKLFDKFGERLK